MKKCKVVYGPQGCGKTRNAGVLMEKLGCTRSIDIEDVRDLSALPEDVLVLTSAPVDGALEYAEIMARG